MISFASMVNIANLATLNADLVEHARTKCGSEYTDELAFYVSVRLEMRQILIDRLSADAALPILAPNTYRQRV